MFSDITKILLGISTFIIGFLFNRNRSLSRDKVFLEREALYQNYKIKKQELIIDVIQNTKDESISGNTKRMRAKKL